MADSKEDKHDVEDKLMANTETKTYGTDGSDGADIQETPEPDRESVTLKMTKIKKKPSLMKRISAYEPSESNIGFIQRIATFVFDTSKLSYLKVYLPLRNFLVLGLIALAVTNFIQIACIIIGSVYINDCPASPGIPVILIVNGAINVLVCIIETVKRRIANRESPTLKKLDIIHSSLKVASTVTFLIWLVMVYDSPRIEYHDVSSQNYCNRTLYLFAFWLLTSFLILLAVIMLFACCCCCFAGFIAGASTAANTTDKLDKVDETKEEPKDQDNI